MVLVFSCSDVSSTERVMRRLIGYMCCWFDTNPRESLELYEKEGRGDGRKHALYIFIVCGQAATTKIDDAKKKKRPSSSLSLSIFRLLAFPPHAQDVRATGQQCNTSSSRQRSFARHFSLCSLTRQKQATTTRPWSTPPRSHRCPRRQSVSPVPPPRPTAGTTRPPTPTACPCRPLPWPRPSARV